MDRFCIKIAGESGSGLLSTGEIITRSLQGMGFYVVAEREYPSLIKGGHACFVINFSKKPIYGISNHIDVMLAIDKSSLKAYFGELKEGGTLVYGYERPLGVKDIIEKATEMKMNVVYLKVREVAEEMGGNVLMKNIVLAGMLWKTLGFDFEHIKVEVERKFASKPKLLAIDLKCLEAGYLRVESGFEIEVPASVPTTRLLEGNEAIALGAVHCGCKAYYAYPMSPASSILTHMADMAEEKGLLVKQIEDEISVANMALGSMYMGARAFCATSGGGLDLMSETVSLAGITEQPLLIVVAQRPGPATGLPTWTCQSDLSLAVHAGHGEFGRMVIAGSDPTTCFDLIQHAFNYAEEYQIPVIFLTEKGIAETIVTVPAFELRKIPIKRGLVSGDDLVNEDRYRITESGVSKRWLPGTSKAFYFAQGDEHLEDGFVTEDAEPAQAMYDKRLRKLDTIKAALPDPEIFGEDGADISFVGWGSSLNIMRDVIAYYSEKGVRVNYLHYAYLWPLKTERLEQFFKENKNVNLIEGNAFGQLGNLIEEKTDLRFKDRLLKYNGRSFFLEDLIEFVEKSNK